MQAMSAASMQEVSAASVSPVSAASTQPVSAANNCVSNPVLLPCQECCYGIYESRPRTGLAPCTRGDYQSISIYVVCC